ncbi:MAG: carbohydrate binding family 9 domain-containing protein [Phycisphaerae bacterium]|nr:carbohydrate binding family 9 domain-containing protein [Phycisphaerae bacterium]
MLRRASVAIVASVLWAVAPCARGEPIAVATRTDEPPKIDGRLGDAAWSHAAAFDAFTQVEPKEGAPPSQRTEVRFLFDREHLYVAVRCSDNDPAGIVARQRARDGDQDGDDRVAIVLDTFLDRRTGYFFAVSAAGARRDGLVDSGRRLRTEWDPLWHAHARIVSDPDEDGFMGWIVEAAIPTRSLNFDAASPAWGLNVERVTRRSNERVRWAAPRRNASLTAMSDAGRLEGLADLEQGLGLTFRPYASLKHDADAGGTELKPGFDVYYNLSTKVSAALTINTDFAEAEVDDRRVNLTRFPLFFPEKREFFLRDSQVFSFGGIMRSPLPFHSRRIGLVRGEPRDILAGARVTGRQGRLRFGVLNALMAEDGTLGQKNLGVARAALDILGESSVGLIATYGHPSATGDNTLVGGDLHLRNSRLEGGRTVEAHAWAMGTQSDDRDNSDASAVGGRLSYPNDDWSFSLFAARIGEDFNPALGFVQRRGVYEFNTHARRRWRWDDGLVRMFEIEVRPSAFTDLDGRIQSSQTELPKIEFENAAGDSLALALNLVQENLGEPFEIADGVVIPLDDYSWTSGTIEFDTSPGRVLSGSVAATAGGFYTGTMREATLGLTWRPGPGFVASVEHEINDADLPEGDFVVRILRLRLNFLFTPDLSWSNFAQYDSESNTAGLNSRFRWEWAPGREFIFVVNQGADVEGRSLTLTRTELAAKALLTFRF